MGQLNQWIGEYRRGWQGIAPPSLLPGATFAAMCLAGSTLARWALALIRTDVFFTPYIPAVFFVTAIAGFRVGASTAIAAGLLGVFVNFGDSTVNGARLALLVIFWMVCALVIWGIEHYRVIVASQRDIARRLIEEEQYRKLVVNELQHRLKNKLSVIHAVMHQVLDKEPAIWSTIDHRLRALSATDDLIARVDGAGCDIRDLLMSELGPYDHVRFTLHGEPLFLPAKLAVSLALIFHELATNAGKYGAFAAARGLLHVSWRISEDRLSLTWDETEGPPVDGVGKPGFGTRLIQSALAPFDGKTEVAYLKTGLHCTMQCRLPKDEEPDVLLRH